MATILVVDDNAINRAFLVTLLGYGKHRMLEATNGAEGLRCMQQERPDLIISDILMPHMDGHEFVTRVHADLSLGTIPVIFYTAGYHEAEANVIARSCGVSRVLAKPAEPAAILRLVNESLGLPHTDILMPVLTTPPVEGSRFSTIDNQIAEYLVELEGSTTLIAQLIAVPDGTGSEAAVPDHTLTAKRLAVTLGNLQAARVRLSALIAISREVAAESQGSDNVPATRANRLPLPDTLSIHHATVATPRVSRERAKFQARLAKALQFAGYPHDSPTQLAREFNARFCGRPVTIHAARKWLVGESIPTQDKLRILAQWLGVTAEWLRFGDTEQPAGLEQIPAGVSPTAEEARLLAELLELDPYHRRLAHDFVSMLAKTQGREKISRRGVRSRRKNIPLSLE